MHFAMLIGNHFTKVVSGKVNVFLGISIWETLLSNTVLRNFYKRSIKAFSIQETKMRGAHEEK